MRAVLPILLLSLGTAQAQTTVTVTETPTTVTVTETTVAVTTSGDGAATVATVGTQGPAGANIPSGGSEGLIPAKVGSGFGWTGATWNTGLNYTFDLPIVGPETTNASSPGLQQTSLGAGVGINSFGFYDTTFNSVVDPVVWWGYNRTGGPANHPRLYWQVEGYYYDATRYWSETYLEKWNTDGTNYRPFTIGTYDAHAEAQFNVDAIAFASRAGVGALYIDPNSRNVQLYSDVSFLVLGNNHYGIKQARTVAGTYAGLIGLNASNQVVLDENAVGVVAAGTVSATGFKIGATSGITGDIIVKGSDGNNCTLTFTGGILTVETCP